MDKPLCLFNAAEYSTVITGYWLSEIMDGVPPVSHPVSYWLNADPPEDADNPSAIRRACRKALDNGFAVWRISESPRLEMFLRLEGGVLPTTKPSPRSPLVHRAITKSAKIDWILCHALDWIDEHGGAHSSVWNQLEAVRSELVAAGFSEREVDYHA